MNASSARISTRLLRYAWAIYVAALLIQAAILHTGDDWRQYHMRPLAPIALFVGVALTVVTIAVHAFNRWRDSRPLR